MKNSRKPSSLWAFIFKRVLAFVVVLVCLLAIFYSVSDEIYWRQIEKYSYDENEIDLNNFEDLKSLPKSFLVNNDITLEIVNENLEVIYSKGKNETSGKIYKDREFEDLVKSSNFEIFTRFDSIRDDKGNENTSIVMKDVKSSVIKATKNITTAYVFSLVVGTLIISILLFYICVNNIYKNIKNAFDFISDKIEKTPHDREKIDITETNLIETREVAKNYNKMLDELRRIKVEKEAITNRSNRLISNLSHDLKSPITTLKGYSEILLKEDVSKENLKEYSGFINDSANDLNYLINVLFEQIKFQYTDYQLNLSEEDINDFLRNICANYYNIFDNKGFDMNIDIDENPCIIVFDRANLKRVFVNILENCYRHNIVPTDVCISSEIVGDKYIVCFKDNGLGISEKDEDKLFEPFYQVDKSRNNGNSGLGLYVAKQIVEKHNGTIRFKREKKYKTIFEIILPIK